MTRCSLPSILLSNGRNCALRLLAAIAVALTAGCHHAPACPPGTTLMGQAPPEGQESWCQKIVDGKPVKEGPFTLYYPGAGKMIEGQYHDGKQAGEWRTWYGNGQLQTLDHYRDGVQEGEHTSWYENGARAAAGQYRNGKREGTWKHWDANGFRNWEEVYKDDKKIS